MNASYAYPPLYRVVSFFDIGFGLVLLTFFGFMIGQVLLAMNPDANTLIMLVGWVLVLVALFLLMMNSRRPDFYRLQVLRQKRISIARTRWRLNPPYAKAMDYVMQQAYPKDHPVRIRWEHLRRLAKRQSEALEKAISEDAMKSFTKWLMPQGRRIDMTDSFLSNLTLLLRGFNRSAEEMKKMHDDFFAAAKNQLA